MLLALHLFRGFFVGIAGLLPGLSGSTWLVIFGLYRPVTAALANPFYCLRENLLRFGPFFLAAGLGILVGSRLLATVFARYETPALYLFMGLMLGALPDLWGHTRRTGGHPTGWLAFIILLAVCVGLALWQEQLIPHARQTTSSWGIWLATGAGIGLGAIIPGSSVALLLIYLGLYQPLLDGVARLDPHILLPVVLGATLSILLFAKAVHWLFQNAEGTVTRGILGLVSGSLWLVFPGWPGGRLGALCLLLLIIGCGGSILLNRMAPPNQIASGSALKR